MLLLYLFEIYRNDYIYVDWRRIMMVCAEFVERDFDINVDYLMVVHFDLNQMKAWKDD